VCGTPGSLVHFYPWLRFLAFDQTRRILAEVSAPGSDAYTLVERMVLNDALAPKMRMARAARREVAKGQVLSRRADDVKGELQRILGTISSRLETACGGMTQWETSALSKCSWEKEMKEYILTFP
jgi:hypothetical protein